jgi:hypothetical protein
MLGTVKVSEFWLDQAAAVGVPEYTVVPANVKVEAAAAAP